MAGQREMDSEPSALLHTLTDVTGSFVASQNSVPCALFVECGLIASAFSCRPCRPRGDGRGAEDGTHGRTRSGVVRESVGALCVQGADIGVGIPVVDNQIQAGGTP